MKRIDVLIGIFVLLLVGLVIADPPSDATSISPNNTIITDDNVTLSVIGISDPDLDVFNITFFEFNKSVLSPKFYNTVVQNDSSGNTWYLNPNSTLDEGGGNDCLGISSGSTENVGNWNDIGCAGSQAFICEELDTGHFFLNQTASTYANANASCRNINTSLGDLWHLAVPSTPAEQDSLAQLCDPVATTYCWIAGITHGIDNWNWDYTRIWNLTVQNSTNTTYDWTGLNQGLYRWGFFATDVNSESSNSSLAFFNITYINLNVTLYDELTNQVIDFQNITVEVSNPDTESQNLTTITGKANFTLTTPEQYRIRYFDTWNQSYRERNYWITLPDGSFTDLNLYMLNGSYSKVFSSDGEQIQVIDSLNNKLEGAIINVNKYFLSSNSFVTIERHKTNFEGISLAHLTNDGFYRFTIEFPENTTVFSTESTQIFQEPLNFIVNLIEDPSGQFFESNGITYTLTFNNVSNRFVYVYNDPGLVATNHCLNLYRFSGSFEEFEEQSCSTSQSGTLFVNLNDGNFTYLGRAFATLSSTGNQTLIDTISTQLGFTDPFGQNGWYILLMLTGIVAFVGFWNLFVALMLLPIPLLFLSTASIIPMAVPVALSVALGIWVIAVIVGRRS